MASIKEIAKIAGVSTATVSRVLNNHPQVRESTRKKVKETILALDYYPNALARGLKTRTSKTIGLLLPEIQNMFIPRVTFGLEEVLKEHGYIALLSYTFYDDKEELRSILAFAERKIDALVHIGTREYAQKKIHFMTNILRGIPLFFINDMIPQDNAYCIYNDEEEGAYLATKHLIDQGHERIAFVNGNPFYTSYFNKRKGFLRALEEAGLSFDPSLYADYQMNLQDVYQPAEAYTQTEKIMGSSDPPTAYFAASDLLAIGIIRYLHEKKILIPEACSVVGFDNIPMAQHTHPPLTTIDQRPKELGRFTGKLLIKSLKEGSLKQKCYSFVPQLIIRESSTGRKHQKISA
ncbi:MAG: LacI family DNA-binding transcriptional regulator [Candidatus Aminicenantes bacterium]